MRTTEETQQQLHVACFLLRSPTKKAWQLLLPPKIATGLEAGGEPSGIPRRSLPHEQQCRTAVHRWQTPYLPQDTWFEFATFPNAAAMIDWRQWEKATGSSAPGHREKECFLHFLDISVVTAELPATHTHTHVFTAYSHWQKAFPCCASTAQWWGWTRHPPADKNVHLTH